MSYLLEISSDVLPEGYIMCTCSNTYKSTGCYKIHMLCKQPEGKYYRLIRRDFIRFGLCLAHLITSVVLDLKVLANEKRGVLAVVSFDWSRFKLFSRKFSNKCVLAPSCERLKTAPRTLFLSFLIGRYL